MQENFADPRGCTTEGDVAHFKRDPLDALDLATTLRQVKVPVIVVECRLCKRSDELERKVLVRKHGAKMTFARLRRMAAMGCERLISDDGDQCQTRFPCLAAER